MADEATDRTPGRNPILRDRLLVVVGLVVALLGQQIIRVILGPFLISMEAWLLLSIGPQWIATGILVGFVVWVERRPLASVGAAWPAWSDLWLGVGGAAVGLLTFLAAISLRNALGFDANEGPLAMILQFPLWAVVLIVITAAVTEEVLFRAYPIERIAEITGSLWIAAAFSLVAFMLLHVPAWGISHLLNISGISIILVALYAWRRRLAPVVIMHFLTNFVLFVVAPTFGWI